MGGNCNAAEKKINNFNYTERSLAKGQEKETIEQKNEPKAMNKQFRVKAFQIPSIHIQNFSNSIVVREIQIKVTMRYHIPNRLKKILKAFITHSWWRICVYFEKLLVDLRLFCLWRKAIRQNLLKNTHAVWPRKPVEINTSYAEMWVVCSIMKAKWTWDL